MKLKYSKQLTLPIVGGAMVAASLLLVGVASAHSGNPPTAAQMQQAKARYEQRLQQAVTDGKLTSAQEQAVLNEHNMLMAELKAAGTANRRQVMKQVRQEAKTWAQQNGVSASWLFRGGSTRTHTGARHAR